MNFMNAYLGGAKTGKMKKKTGVLRDVEQKRVHVYKGRERM